MKSICVPFAFLTAAGVLTLAACSSSPSQPEAASTGPLSSSTAQLATVVLAPASGSLVSGKLEIAPTSSGVRLTSELGGLTRGGTHAIHIHEKGDCSAADATSAGGHFNPTQQPHGRVGSGAHHGGDMDNLVARASARICATVAATSQVSVLVMLCTEMGASPPTATLPTMIFRDLRRTMGEGLCISVT